MSCDDVRAMLIDALVARRPPASPAVLAHLESCAACRAAGADYETLWRELGDLLPVAPAPDAAARFARRPTVVGASPRAASAGLGKYVGAIAAAFVVVALLVGYWAGTRHSSGSAASGLATTAGTEPTFLLLLHIDSTFRRGTTPAEETSRLHEYERWSDGLAPGTLVDGERLVRDRAGWVGPLHAAAAADDQVDGFFLIHAKDLNAAQQVAATCPHLKYGGRIELREINRS